MMDVDAGNGGHTLITAPFARQLGLVDELGRPRWQTRVQRVQVRGVVAGASESVPVMTLSYEVAGESLSPHWPGDSSDLLKYTEGSGHCGVAEGSWGILTGAQSECTTTRIMAGMLLKVLLT